MQGVNSNLNLKAVYEIDDNLLTILTFHGMWKRSF